MSGLWPAAAVPFLLASLLLAVGLAGRRLGADRRRRVERIATIGVAAVALLVCAVAAAAMIAAAEWLRLALLSSLLAASGLIGLIRRKNAPADQTGTEPNA